MCLIFLKWCITAECIIYFENGLSNHKLDNVHLFLLASTFHCTKLLKNQWHIILFLKNSWERIIYQLLKFITMLVIKMNMIHLLNNLVSRLWIHVLCDFLNIRITQNLLFKVCLRREFKQGNNLLCLHQNNHLH